MKIIGKRVTSLFCLARSFKLIIHALTNQYKFGENSDVTLILHCAIGQESRDASASAVKIREHYFRSPAGLDFQVLDRPYVFMYS